MWIPKIQLCTSVCIKLLSSASLKRTVRGSIKDWIIFLRNRKLVLKLCFQTWSHNKGEEVQVIYQLIRTQDLINSHWLYRIKEREARKKKKKRSSPLIIVRGSLWDWALSRRHQKKGTNNSKWRDRCQIRSNTSQQTSNKSETPSRQKLSLKVLLMANSRGLKM